ncbi:MAG: hypothetical protein E6767_03505 [Dysgonomonas sp.]|nr:hypothetical protein [Dysgonomonas sp.]
MLYSKKYITDTTLIGIWKVEESREEMLSTLAHHEWVELIQTIKSESRVLEILAARLLLKELAGEEKQVYYNSSGKPFLSDNSFHISVSHTKKFIAVALNKKKPIGLDIEQISDKIQRVKSRVIAKDEYIDSDNELVHLLLHWSAKEAMFKFLDADSIDFREHLIVGNFKPKREGEFFASEHKTDSNHKFKAYYLVEDEFVMVCLEED